MNRTIGDHFTIPPAAFQSIVGVTILIVVPLYDRVFVPNVRKITNHHSGITSLQRIGVGLFIATFNMVTCIILTTFYIHCYYVRFWLVDYNIFSMWEGKWNGQDLLYIKYLYPDIWIHILTCPFKIMVYIYLDNISISNSVWIRSVGRIKVISVQERPCLFSGPDQFRLELGSVCSASDVKFYWVSNLKIMSNCGLT